MLNAVVDMSHHNPPVDFAKMKAAGIAAVVHKATQGVGFKDSAYAGRKSAALAAGLLWGAYHFADGSDVQAQLANFFSVATMQDLLVLDVEQNTGGTTMTLAQAEAFVSAVFAKTGKWPGLYCGAYLKGLLGPSTKTPLSNCWLWYAQYAAAPQIPPQWKKWTMWQYTDGQNGPQPHGIGQLGNFDRDQFNGDLGQLQSLFGVHPE